VKLKVNSIVDETVIDALYRASQAGAKVDLLVRGISALRPGVPGLSENIRVRSILGRFLEHSRIFAFANSGGPAIGEGPDAGPEVFIGSADLMHRNLDRRVETLARVTDPLHIIELTELIDTSMSDSTSSWHLRPDGAWERHSTGPDGQPLRDMQSVLIQRQRRRLEPVR
jgi:polyphosphate kinase